MNQETNAPDDYQGAKEPTQMLIDQLTTLHLDSPVLQPLTAEDAFFVPGPPAKCIALKCGRRVYLQQSRCGKLYRVVMKRPAGQADDGGPTKQVTTEVVVSEAALMCLVSLFAHFEADKQAANEGEEVPAWTVRMEDGLVLGMGFGQTWMEALEAYSREQGFTGWPYYATTHRLEVAEVVPPQESTPPADGNWEGGQEIVLAHKPSPREVAEPVVPKWPQPKAPDASEPELEEPFEVKGQPAPEPKPKPKARKGPEPVEVRNGWCTCTVLDQCPLGKSGHQPKCTAADLLNAGVPVGAPEGEASSSMEKPSVFGWVCPVCGVPAHSESPTWRAFIVEGQPKWHHHHPENAQQGKVSWVAAVAHTAP